MNKSEQTAYDIARFWGHKHIATLLRRGQDGDPHRVLPDMHSDGENLYFNHEFLDRLSERRTDSTWLAAKQRAPDTVFLLFYSLNPLVTSEPLKEDGRGDCSYQLSRLRRPSVETLLGHPNTTVIFLGVEKPRTCAPNTAMEGEDDGLTAWFALSTEEDPTELVKFPDPQCAFLQAPMPDLLKLSDNEAGRRLRNSHLKTFANYKAQENHSVCVCVCVCVMSGVKRYPHYKTKYCYNKL